MNQYNILFVGNSITLHGLASYWWSKNRGMASSSTDKDYVHLVESGLRTIYSDVNADVVNYSIWEMQSNDREETYPMIDRYLTDSTFYDCIVVQLGENIYDAMAEYSTFADDFFALISHIRENKQEAKIIIIGNFWTDKAVDYVKSKAAEVYNCSFIDLSPIQNNPEYMAGIGTEVMGDDEMIHTINHAGVAQHPGDEGMKWMANRILEEIKL